VVELHHDSWGHLLAATHEISGEAFDWQHLDGAVECTFSHFVAIFWDLLGKKKERKKKRSEVR
jgi:hypothetical protein